MSDPLEVGDSQTKDLDRIAVMIAYVTTKRDFT